MTDRLITISVSKRAARRIVAAAAVLALASQVGAQQPATITESASSDEIQKFCTNIADPARDRRYLLQKQDLEKLQADVDERIKVLEERTAEYQHWLKRRNEFLANAKAGLIDIYKKMKPDAAAPQLEQMQVEIAAAIVMQLPPRQSALFLAEMAPETAGMISMIIASASDPNTSKAATSSDNPKAPS